MTPEIKKVFQVLILAFLYVIFFLILIPPLIKVMDQRWGQVLYGALVVGALVVAFRLRFVSRQLR